MVLAYRKYESSLGMDSNVAESEGTLRGDRLGLTLASNCVKASVTELRIDDSAARYVVFTAAIFVHSVAHIGRCWGDLDWLTAGNKPSPQTGPASFVGSGLQPIDMHLIDLHSGESN
jgi:hypothetical protein